MSEPTKFKGSCLCGAVTLSATRVDQRFSACHCATCRTWGGGPLLVIDCGTDVQIEGKQSVTVFDSSSWAERGFCARCGTHLFYRIKQSQRYQVPLGLFGDAVNPSFSRQLFCDKKPPYYTFADETEELTEAQVFAIFAPKS